MKVAPGRANFEWVCKSLALDGEITYRAGDLSVAGAHPLVVPKRHVFCVEILQKLRKVVRQLRQHIVVCLEGSEGGNVNI